MKPSDSPRPVLSDEQCVSPETDGGVSLYKCFTAPENQESCKCDTATQQAGFVLSVLAL